MRHLPNFSVFIVGMMAAVVHAKTALHASCISALHNATLTREERCSLTTQHCSHVAESFDYLSTAVCHLGAVPYWTTCMGFASFVALMLMLLATTSERYFIPPLLTISDFLRLSPTVAGMTLLAVG